MKPEDFEDSAASHLFCGRSRHGRLGWRLFPPADWLSINAEYLISLLSPKADISPGIILLRCKLNLQPLCAELVPIYTNDLKLTLFPSTMIQVFWLTLKGSGEEAGTRHGWIVSA